MGFEHRIRPRYAEIDAQGVVFNAHWLTFCDDACTRFFAHLGFEPKELFTGGGTFDCMLVAAKLDWTGSAGFDDEIRIEVVPVRLGNSSFDLRYTARVNDVAVLVSTITYVSVTPGTHAPTPIPEDVRARLASAMPD